MKNKVKKAILNIIASVQPTALYCLLLRLLRLVKQSPVCGMSDLLRLYKGVVTKEKTEKYKKVMVFKKGLYDYEYFNICFLNNMLALCLRAVCEGYIPRIQILNSKGDNIWEMFFQQPFADIPDMHLPTTIIEDPHYLENFPAFEAVYNREVALQWGKVFSFFIRFNERSKAYIEEEIDGIIKGKNVLGVLCRGTDYIETKPKGHPVQPDLDSLIAKVEEVFKNGGYQYIYLATEDGRYDRAFRSVYGDRLLINKRKYYDRVYFDQKVSLIKDVHFNRDDDEYLKGIEYFSSLQILSKCQGLVAGNCSGTQAAVFWNNGNYKDIYIFDLGLYE